MYKSVAALLFLLASACHRAPAPITFDGAFAADKAALISHGDRLSHVLGCRGCHTNGLKGRDFTGNGSEFGQLYASNLAQVLPSYSDSGLERLLRTGVHPTRKNLWIMPSEVLQNLSAPDMQALIAYLRTVKPAGKPTPPPVLSTLDRQDIAAGTFKPAAQLVKEYQRSQPADLGPRYALGRYITMTTCAACHGPSLQGQANNPILDARAPDLLVAAGYSRTDFDKLITQGIPTPPRKLNPMMVRFAKHAFAYLTPHERDALYAYLKARAEKIH